jgi:hypothetical protein
VRIKSEVKQPHAKRFHHQSLAAHAVGDDSLTVAVWNADENDFAADAGNLAGGLWIFW